GGGGTGARLRSWCCQKSFDGTDCAEKSQSPSRAAGGGVALNRSTHTFRRIVEPGSRGVSPDCPRCPARPRPGGRLMRVQARLFHPMLGHVQNGTVVDFPNGSTATVYATMRGWCLQSGGLTIWEAESAHELTSMTLQLSALRDHDHAGGKPWPPTNPWGSAWRPTSPACWGRCPSRRGRSRRKRRR